MTETEPRAAAGIDRTMTEEESIALVDDLCLRYRNWGRWGYDDQRGTLNFITPEALVYAATMIRTGRIVSCGLPFHSDGPQSGGFGGRTNPVHSMLQDGGDIALGAQDDIALLRYTDDAVTMPLQCGTQWDALAHIFYRGQMYNGHGLEHVTSKGAFINGIENIADAVALPRRPAGRPAVPGRRLARPRRLDREQRVDRVRRSPRRGDPFRRHRPRTDRSDRPGPSARSLG